MDAETLVGQKWRLLKATMDERFCEDIDAVMQAQQDLVEGVHALRQVLCVKG